MYYILDGFYEIVEEVGGIQFLEEPLLEEMTAYTARKKILSLLEQTSIPGIRNMRVEAFSNKDGYKITLSVLDYKGGFVWVTADYSDALTIKYYNRMGKQIFNLDKRPYIDYD